MNSFLVWLQGSALMPELTLASAVPSETNRKFSFVFNKFLSHTDKSFFLARSDCCGRNT
jgi:hypothetical protein